MKKIDIWVEGIADQKFLADILNKWFILKGSWNEKDKLFDCISDQIHVKVRDSREKSNAGGGVSKFISDDGWNKIKSLFQNNNINSVKNLIILDADNSFDGRKNEVVQTVKDENFNVDSDLFLLPNQSENGDLETLLERIINPEHKTIFECWNAYEDCLRKSPGKTYTTPARKTKIYAYLEALLGETKSEKDKIKEREREYYNPNHWQLDHSKEPLKPLHEFLKQHLGL